MNNFKALKLITIIFLLGCSNSYENDSKIIFTTGIAMDPSEPRIGIEIKPDTLFYCLEKHEKAEYDYYYCLQRTNVEEYIRKLKPLFNYYPKYSDIPDATPCQLDIVEKQDTLRFVFYLELINDKQREIIHDLITLKDCDTIKIEHRDFPVELLLDKLPEPPLVGNDTD
ncbi:hypothetical protein [Flavobacterium litorale]|uniref:Lipoprotein n=1 Tax=Flavobacterium litorale TaxID=2856519 RepID=A0ABX8V5Z2_9FLAO|nr:hypothetical protein [Flavobacterium litorale]QYJ68242.1 hypothetical protein K1I41_12050 [Flavobacterium litorale]